MTTVERDNDVQIIGAENVQALPIDAPAGAEKDNDRDYVVLKRHKADSPNSPQMWEFVTNIRAANPEQAGRRAAEQPGTSFLNTDGPTFLVVVPVRNFSTFTLTVKTETTIVIS